MINSIDGYFLPVLYLSVSPLIQGAERYLTKLKKKIKHWGSLIHWAEDGGGIITIMII